MFGDNVSSGTIYTVQLLISCPKAALSTSSCWFNMSRLQLWREAKIKYNKKVPCLYQRLSGLTSVYVQVRSSKTGGVGAETRFNKRCTDRLVQLPDLQLSRPKVFQRRTISHPTYQELPCHKSKVQLFLCQHCVNIIKIVNIVNNVLHLAHLFVNF